QSWAAYAFRHTRFRRPDFKYSSEYLEAEAEYYAQDYLVVSPVAGCFPNTEEVKTEIVKRDQIWKEYGMPLIVGIVPDGDVDAAVDKYIQMQKDAGLDKVLQVVQAQVDESTK
ncbi:MAG: DUF3502 domain-containing protein, partial [Clostridiales bacterium]|nr:DUF3502 domain-containing protein [Clostridiales bacterium]